jgi:hypothetical protein
VLLKQWAQLQSSSFGHRSKTDAHLVCYRGSASFRASLGDASQVDDVFG